MDASTSCCFLAGHLHDSLKRIAFDYDMFVTDVITVLVVVDIILFN